MKNFNIPQIKKGEFIFELANEMEIGFLIQYYAPFTGGTCCVIPSGFKFAITSSMRDDAFYMSPIANNKDVEDNLYLKMKELSKSSDPNLANRIQGFSFYITETQLRSPYIIFLKGNRDILFDIIDKQKEQTEYFKDFNPFEDNEWVKTNFGSTYSELEECGKPKVLKTNTDICPCCGSIMRRVYWGEITPEILQLKKEHKIFIGEVLYGKDNQTDYRKKYGDYKIIQSTNLSNHPDFACGDCGSSFILRNKKENNLPLISKIGEKLKNLF